MWRTTPHPQGSLLEPCHPGTESGPSSRDLPPFPSTRPRADTWRRSGLPVGWPHSAPTPPVYLSLSTPTGRRTPRPPTSLLLGRHVPSSPCRQTPRLPRLSRRSWKPGPLAGSSAPSARQAASTPKLFIARLWLQPQLQGQRPLTTPAVWAPSPAVHACESGSASGNGGLWAHL